MALFCFLCSPLVYLIKVTTGLIRFNIGTFHPSCQRRPTTRCVEHTIDICRDDFISLIDCFGILFDLAVLALFELCGVYLT